MVTAETPSLTIHDRYDERSIAEYRERGWWPGGSAPALLDHWAEVTPRRRFVSDGTAELDYATVRERSRGLGAALLRAGVRAGDRVAVQLPNWAEFTVAYLAVARIRAVLVPIMTVNRRTEVGYVLRDSGAVAAITTGVFRGFDHAAMFRDLQGECPELRTLVIARADAAAGERAFEQACATGTDDGELGGHPDPDLPHLVVYTSGTESTAKGCVHTWNTLNFSARGLAHEVFRTGGDDVMFMPSPVAHATGFLVGLLIPLITGSETHLLDVWEPDEALRRIEAYRCTASATATPFVRMALDAHAAGPERDLSSMRFWLCAGAPIPSALATEFDRAFDGGVLMPLYGCTELLAVTCCHPGDPLERRAGSDGSPALDGIEVTLVGPDGGDVPTGQEGEICYRGPGAILGYWRDPERTAATVHDGRHHTGDLGRYDEHGYLRVTGRIKDIIIRGGTNISAAEVEGHVAAHPSVAQVAVVAYPDERLGEKVCAVVVAAAGGRPTLEDVTTFLRGRDISAQKLPEKLVVVDALPMTATGKVQKFVLREQVRHA